MTLGGFGDSLNAISAEGAITSFNIANGTILGTDISDATITGSKIALETIRFDTLDVSLSRIVLGSTGTFEITNDTSGGSGDFNASFYYQENGENIYLFENEYVILGTTRYIPYAVPPNFAIYTFKLEIDVNIKSYSLNYTPPVNGILNHSKVGTRRIEFNIGRNIQNYLELDILTV